MTFLGPAKQNLRLPRIRLPGARSPWSPAWCGFAAAIALLLGAGAAPAQTSKELVRTLIISSRRWLILGAMGFRHREFDIAPAGVSPRALALPLGAVPARTSVKQVSKIAQTRCRLGRLHRLGRDFPLALGKSPRLATGGTLH